MLLEILPLDDAAASLYENHGTYHCGDSGLDLFITEDHTIESGETAFLRLGIKCAAFDRDGSSASWLLMPRSSISKTPLRLCNSIGLIDSGYRGEVVAAVDNVKREPYTVKRGDRLVQAVSFDGKEVSFKVRAGGARATLQIVSELGETSRGEKGYGSTEGATKRLKVAAGNFPAI
eukprot:Polyplicarium_translucidae@DN2622_c0_g1_i4.p1